MKRAKTKIITTLLAVTMAFSLTACTNQDDIDNAVSPLSEQITTINLTLTEMQTLDTTLDGYIDTLNSKVATLETDLSAVNTTLKTFEENSATKTVLTETKTALESEINAIKEDITELKTKDTELDGKITALQTALSTEITDTETWIEETFATKTACDTLKTEINASIAELQGKIDGLETSVETLENTVTALQTQVEEYTSKIEELENRINCLEGNHVANAEITATYVWADDFSTCTATGVCAYCSDEVTETATATYDLDWYGYYLYTATFENEGFVTQTHDGKKTVTVAAGATYTYRAGDDFSSPATVKNIGTTDVTIKGNFESSGYLGWMGIGELTIPAGGAVTVTDCNGKSCDYFTTTDCAFSFNEIGVLFLISGELTIANGTTVSLYSFDFTNNTGDYLTITLDGVTVTLTEDKAVSYKGTTYTNGTVTFFADGEDIVYIPANGSIEITNSQLTNATKLTAGNGGCEISIDGSFSLCDCKLYSGSFTKDGVRYGKETVSNSFYLYSDGVGVRSAFDINGITFKSGTVFDAKIAVVDGNFTVTKSAVVITLDANESITINGYTLNGGESGKTYNVPIEGEGEPTEVVA